MGIFSSNSTSYNTFQSKDTSIKKKSLITSTDSLSFKKDNNSSSDNTYIETVDFSTFFESDEEINESGISLSGKKEIERVHNTLENKTVESIRKSEGEESIFFQEVTSYTDGTTVETGINQKMYPGGVESITIPIAPEGNEINYITFENREDGLIMLETSYEKTIIEDPQMGKIEKANSYDTTKFYENREDGLVKTILNPKNDNFDSRDYYQGREEGIIQVDTYKDKKIYTISKDDMIYTIEKEIHS